MVSSLPLSLPFSPFPAAPNLTKRPYPNRIPAILSTCDLHPHKKHDPNAQRRHCSSINLQLAVRFDYTLPTASEPRMQVAGAHRPKQPLTVSRTHASARSSPRVESSSGNSTVWIPGLGRMRGPGLGTDRQSTWVRLQLDRGWVIRLCLKGKTRQRQAEEKTTFFECFSILCGWRGTLSKEEPRL